MTRTNTLKLGLSILGGFLVLINGSIYLIDFFFGIVNWRDISNNIPKFNGFLGEILMPFVISGIAIILGILILVISIVFIVRNEDKKFQGFTILVLGILALFFSSFIGAGIVIIAGILLLPIFS